MTTQTLPTGMKQLKPEDLVINTIVSNDLKSRKTMGYRSAWCDPIQCDPFPCDPSYCTPKMCSPNVACSPNGCFPKYT